MSQIHCNAEPIVTYAGRLSNEYRCPKCSHRWSEKLTPKRKAQTPRPSQRSYRIA